MDYGVWVEKELKTAVVMTIQVGDGGGWSRMEVGKAVRVVDEDWLMETGSGRMILVSDTKFAKRSSKMKRAWQPTSVSSPGEFHGQKSLDGYNL